MELILDGNVQMVVGSNPANPAIKVLSFLCVDNNIRVSVPMSTEAARALGAQLTSGVIVAPGPLAEPRGPNGKVN